LTSWIVKHEHEYADDGNEQQDDVQHELLEPLIDRQLLPILSQPSQNFHAPSLIAQMEQRSAGPPALRRSARPAV